MSAIALDGAIPPGENTHLYGHQEAQAFLAQAYRAARIHHAILIEGPEGIGKATLAFRFAHHVLAHPDSSSAPAALSDPDPESPAFRKAASGASHNLLHLARPVDEKTGRVRSAITVDEVRRAGRFFSQTSGGEGWRIVIVDPADDLNRSAANAILKMLEEPPRRALFLVISHAPGRLLPTIRSRCLTLRLNPLAAEPLAAALDGLPATRAVSAEDKARLVARSEGSVARAVMIMNYGGLDIIEAFETILTEGPERGRRSIHALADTLSARDREEAFRFLCDHVLDWIAGRARALALEGNGERAAAYAALAARTERALTDAGAYNLDRKQTVIDLLSSLFDVPPA